MYEADLEALRQMKEKISQIEQYAHELKSLGEGVPAVEKNAAAILSSIYLLKFGISDVVDAQEAVKSGE